MEAAHGFAICPEDEPLRGVGAEVTVQLLDWRDHSALFTEQADITK
jgi:hypothetical protein